MHDTDKSTRTVCHVRQRRIRIRKQRQVVMAKKHLMKYNTPQVSAAHRPDLD